MSASLSKAWHAVGLGPRAVELGAAPRLTRGPAHGFGNSAGPVATGHPAGPGCAPPGCGEGLESIHGPGVHRDGVDTAGRAVWSEMWDVAAPSRKASTPFTAAEMSG